MRVSIVTVALNEEEGLVRVLDSLPLDVLQRQGHETQVIVVDGGSSDRTREMAHGRALVVDAPRGYGRQYQVGFAHARGEVIVTLDADGSYPADLIPDLVGMLDGVDFVSVNRFADIAPDAMSLQHHLGNRVLSSVTNRLFGLGLEDSQSGMWAFRRDILEGLHLDRTGMAFSEELKIEAFRKCRALEVPGRYRARIGRAKIRSWQDGLGNLGFLLMRWLQEESARVLRKRLAPSRKGSATMSDWIEVGAEAPDFTLKAHDGSEVRLSDFRGRPVVLYFYPKDDTPGCTREACGFRDARAEVERRGAVVLGVSPDDEKRHTKFREKYGLAFPLLADTDHQVAERYGAYRQRSNYGKKYMGVQRSTWIIGPDGKVAQLWKAVKVDGHVDQVIGALDKLGVPR